MNAQILDIIYGAIAEENALLDRPIDFSRGPETALYGMEGQLDSMGLVSLVVAVEQALEARLGRRLTLVSDRAMSARRSPFATAGSFATYVQDMLEEAARV